MSKKSFKVGRRLVEIIKSLTSSGAERYKSLASSGAARYKSLASSGATGELGAKVG